jgi:hypothetical protein
VRNPLGLISPPRPYSAVLTRAPDVALEWQTVSLTDAPDLTGPSSSCNIDSPAREPSPANNRSQLFGTLRIPVREPADQPEASSWASDRCAAGNAATQHLDASLTAADTTLNVGDRAAATSMATSALKCCRPSASPASDQVSELIGPVARDDLDCLQVLS